MCPRERHLWLIYPKNLLVCGLLFCCHASLTPVILLFPVWFYVWNVDSVSWFQSELKILGVWTGW